MAFPINVVIMSFPPPRRPPKPFAFDGEYRTASTGTSTDKPAGGLVSFFSDEPPPARSTEWSATPVTEEDLREGMDDYKRSEETGEDLKDLIAAMPHNVARRDQQRESK
jgi:hypothetical protein